MTTALTFPGAGGRVVTRAKKDRSVLIRGQGRVPFWPMPRRVGSLVGVVEERVGTGVVATIRVRGGFWGGILGD